MATDTRDTAYATKYAKKLDQIFSESSLTLPHMTKRGEYNEDEGVASVYFRTVDTSSFLSGHTSSSFGTASDISTDVTRKDVELFYQVNKTIPAVDINDTAGALKEAGKIMSLGVKEQYAPLLDKLAFAAAISAATGYGGKNVVAYDAENPLKSLGSAIAQLKNVRSYAPHQTLFIAASAEPDFDANLFTSYTPAKNDENIETGVIGRLKGIKTVIVPDELFVTMSTTGTAPYKQATFTAATKVKAILWDNRLMGSVNKMKDIAVLTGDMARAAGSDGAVLRALFRPGAWVLDAAGKNKAIAILQTTGSGS